MNNIRNLINKQKNPSGRHTKPFYSIVSKKAGKVIDVAQNGPFKESVIIWDGYNGDNQAFTLIQEGPDWPIRCKKGWGYLTVEHGGDRARIFLLEFPGPQSKFRLD